MTTQTTSNHNGKNGKNSHPVSPAKSVQSSSKLVTLFSKEWPLITSMVLIVIALTVIALLERERASLVQVRGQLATHKQEKQITAAISPEDIQLLEQSFLKEDGVVVFIQKLEQARVAFSAFDLNFTSEAPEGKTVKYLTFELRVAGPVENIKQLVSGLVESSYALEITDLEITSEDAFRQAGEMTLAARIYITE